MCFAVTFDESCLEKLDQFIYDNVPFQQYSHGCWLISKIVKTITGATPKCVGIFNLRRGGMIPHWINKRRMDGLIDLKRRCFRDGRDPINPSWQEDGKYFIPTGRHYFDLDTKGQFFDENAFWAPEQHDKYIDFVENDTWSKFEEMSWLPHYNKVIYKWYHNEEC